jgi:Ca2+-binding RTX toxin-like protein
MTGHKPARPRTAVRKEQIHGAVINGTPGDDTLVGTPMDDQINGLAGVDTINGAAGNEGSLVLVRAGRIATDHVPGRCSRENSTA